MSNEPTIAVHLTRQELLTLLSLDVGYEIIKTDSKLYNKLFEHSQTLFFTNYKKLGTKES